MIGDTISGEGLISLAEAKMLVYAMWYAALFWLPVRASAALIDRWNEHNHARQWPYYDHSAAALRADSYRIGR